MANDVKAAVGTAIKELVGAKPKRPRADVQADLDAAKAEFQQMVPRAEAEYRKTVRQDARIDQAKGRWKIEHPEEPFDPEAFSPPLVPYVTDPQFSAAYHKQHYVIDKLEKELAETDHI